MFWYPVRRSLAAALLAAGKPRDAEAELARLTQAWPWDPLSAAMLSKIARADGRTAEADRQLAAARNGWTGDPLAVAPGLL